ncbi:uncharacterized protein LOC108227531 isoform X2 [Daucus carota subsp. sativus]|uniref:uncharacterized protein LOC108227531 isoform X2 n=1 Tax=Daucus carota subsp. sativus TaxID=79200 RepID=UPI0030827B7A
MPRVVARVSNQDISGCNSSRVSNQDISGCNSSRVSNQDISGCNSSRVSNHDISGCNSSRNDTRNWLPGSTTDMRGDNSGGDGRRGMVLQLLPTMRPQSTDY